MSAVISEKQRVPHPNSLANLNVFRPGQSGNPGGVAKGTVFVSEVYKRLMSLPLDQLAAFEPSNAAEAAALKQVHATIDAPHLDALPSLKEITDRTEGKARQAVDVNATTINVNVQVNLFLDAAADLADRHGVPLELAQARMLALAEPAQRAAIEAALAVADATERK